MNGPEPAAASARSLPNVWADLVNHQRYPLSDNDAGGAELRTAARCRFDTEGLCVLDGFLTRHAVHAVLAELEALMNRVHVSTTRSTVYLEPGDLRRPVGHPCRREHITRVGTLAEDELGRDSLLGRLHASPMFRRLVADIVGAPTVHGYADGLTSVNALVFGEGDEIGWHFDEAEFAVTLLLQSADVGGEFEYIPHLRSPQCEDYEAVRGALEGEIAAHSLGSPRAGNLLVFRGRYSLHRVTRVHSVTPRIVAVLSYDSHPGLRLSEHDRQLFFGRSD